MISAPSDGDEVVRLERVSRKFRSRLALDALSLVIRRGEILALLGPNGAGKSTTLALLLGHLRPTSGEVLVRGVPVSRDRRRALRGIGVVVDAPAFHGHLSGWEWDPLESTCRHASLSIL